MRYFEEPTGDNPKYPCGTCKLNVHKTHKAVQCDLCNYWNHIKCDRIDNNVYETLKKSDEQYFCYQCKEEAIPFYNLSHQQFFASVKKGLNKDLGENSDLKFPAPALKSFFANINDLNQPQDHDESSSINCEYYEADASLPKLNSNKNFSLFHLNIASLGLHKEELEDLLSILDLNFDVVGLTETKIKKYILPIYDTSLNGYNTFITPTESGKGGGLFYTLKINIIVNQENILIKNFTKLGNWNLSLLKL